MKNSTYLILFCFLLLQACNDNKPKAVEGIRKYYQTMASNRNETVPVYDVAELELTDVGSKTLDSARLEYLQFNYGRYAKMQALRAKQIEDANLKIDVQQESLDPRYTAGDVNVEQFKTDLTAFGDSMMMMTRGMESVRQRLASNKEGDGKFYRASFLLNKVLNGVEEKANERTTLLLDKTFKVLDMEALMKE